MIEGFPIQTHIIEPTQLGELVLGRLQELYPKLSQETWSGQPVIVIYDDGDTIFYMLNPLLMNDQSVQAAFREIAGTKLVEAGDRLIAQVARGDNEVANFSQTVLAKIQELNQD